MCRSVPFLAILSLVVYGCSFDGGTASRNPARDREDAIKARSSERLSISKQASAIQTRAVLVSSVEPALSQVIRLEALSDGSLILVDNLNGKLSRAEWLDRKVAVRPWAGSEGVLRFPHAARWTGDSLLVWDAKGLTVFDPAGRVVGAVRSFVGAYDFATDGKWLFANPTDRREDAALILKLDLQMQVAERWGRREGGLQGRMRARAYLGHVDRRVVVGFVHRPLITLLDGHSRRDVALSFPGLDELMALEGDEALTMPGNGLVRLPTYVAGVCVLRGRAYVLVDLPELYLLRLGAAGVVEAQYVGTQRVYGRHYLGLTGVDGGGNTGELFTLALDPSGVRSVIGIQIAFP